MPWSAYSCSVRAPLGTLAASSLTTGTILAPWCYDFNSAGGSLIYSPPSTICRYISCIGNFRNGGGYVIQCRDGAFGKSGGIQGSCSSHGGNSRPLYAH